MTRHLSHSESLHIAGSFIDVGQLKAFNISVLPDFAWAYVDGIGEYYFDLNSGEAESIPDIIAPDAGAPGRWKKKALSAISDFNIIKQTAASSGKLSLSGGTLTGPLTLHADPANALHAATKQYVDNLITGISWKDACKAATTANITLTGIQTVDDVSLTTGDRVLVKNQFIQTENGIYVVTSGAWNRAEDVNSNSELETATVLVEQGTANKNTQWTCTSTNVTIGISSISFGQISGAGTYTAGAGLQLTGSEFKLDATYFADGSRAGLLSSSDWSRLNNSFVNGGNVFGTNASIGTGDNNSLQLLTNNISRVAISAGGDVQITNTTVASSSATGALVVGGGIGVGGNSYFTGKTVFSSTNVNPSNRSILQLFSPNTTGTGQTWTVGIGVSGGGPGNGALVFTSGNANMGGNNVSDVLILNPNGAITAINGVTTTQLITKGIEGTTDVGTGINISKPSNVGALSATSGTINFVKIGQPLSGAASNTQFTPSSGNAVFNTLTIDHIFNQTGTANGTIRGIYYNPVATSILGEHYALQATSGKVSLSGVAGNSGAVFTLSAGTATSGSYSITYDANTVVKAGDTITGTGIPAGTYITQVISSTNAVLSAAATATTTGLTFTITPIAFGLNLSHTLDNANNYTGAGVYISPKFTTNSNADKSVVIAKSTPSGHVLELISATSTSTPNHLLLTQPNSTTPSQWGITIGTQASGSSGNIVFSSGSGFSHVASFSPSGTLTLAGSASGNSIIGKGTLWLMNDSTIPLKGVSVGRINPGALSAINESTGTSGTVWLFNIGDDSRTAFSPASGTLGINYFQISPTLNQTGTASGTIRGIYYNPTITSVLGTHNAWESTSGDILVSAGKVTWSGATITSASTISGVHNLGGAAVLNGAGSASATVYRFAPSITTNDELQQARAVVITGTYTNNVAPNNYADNLDLHVIGNQAIGKSLSIGTTATGWHGTTNDKKGRLHIAMTNSGGNSNIKPALYASTNFAQGMSRGAIMVHVDPNNTDGYGIINAFKGQVLSTQSGNYVFVANGVSGYSSNTNYSSDSSFSEACSYQAFGYFQGNTNPITVSTYYAFRSQGMFQATSGGSATVTTWYDYATADYTGTGNGQAITRYGIYLGHTKSNSTNAYGIYQTSNTVSNFFGGPVSIGTGTVGLLSVTMPTETSTGGTYNATNGIKIVGTGTGGSTYSFWATDNSGLMIGATSVPLMYLGSSGFYVGAGVTQTGASQYGIMVSGTGVTGGLGMTSIRYNSSIGATSGTYTVANIQAASFAPASGNANLTLLNLNGTWNQTGSATGIIRGIYYNPGVTSVLGAHYAFEATVGKVKIGDNTGASGLNTGALQVAGGASFNAKVTIGAIQAGAGNLDVYASNGQTASFQSDNATTNLYLISTAAASTSNSTMLQFKATNTGTASIISTGLTSNFSVVTAGSENSNFKIEGYSAGTYGPRLQITGSVATIYSGATSWTFNGNTLQTTGTNAAWVISGAGGSGITLSNTNAAFSIITAGANNSNNRSVSFSYANPQTYLSSTISLLWLNQVVNTTVGGADYNSINIAPTITRAGTDAGITRGIYYNPTVSVLGSHFAFESTSGDILAGGTGKYLINDGGTTRAALSVVSSNNLALGNTFAAVTVPSTFAMKDSAGTVRNLFQSLNADSINLGPSYNKINILSPVVTLINENSAVSRGFTVSQSENGAAGAVFRAQKSRGTNAAPANVNIGDILGGILFSAYVGGAFTSNRSYVNSFMDSTSGQALGFYTGTTNDNYTPAMLIASSGLVGIGNFGTVYSGYSITSPTALLDLGASNTSRASFRIRSGTAPTTPNDGDIWFDNSNLYIRIDGITKTFNLS